MTIVDARRRRPSSNGRWRSAGGVSAEAGGRPAGGLDEARRQAHGRDLLSGRSRRRVDVDEADAARARRGAPPQEETTSGTKRLRFYGSRRAT